MSPILFNVHIYDLEDAVPNHVNIDSCKHADDCTQYQIVERGACSTMKEAVDGLSEWADTNKMESKKDKGYVDLFYRFNPRTTPYPNQK